MGKPTELSSKLKKITDFHNSGMFLRAIPRSSVLTMLFGGEATLPRPGRRSNLRGNCFRWSGTINIVELLEWNGGKNAFN